MFNRRGFFGRLLGLAAAPVAVEQVMKEEVKAEPKKVMDAPFLSVSGYSHGFLASGQIGLYTQPPFLMSGSIGRW